MKQFLGPAAALVLAACTVACSPRYDYQQPTGPAVTFTPAQLTQAQIEAVHAGVRRELRDPESARFGTIVAAQSSRGPLTVCGWVNAKNGFGGYTGDQPYFGVFRNGAFDPSFVGGDRNEIERTMIICRSDGKYLP
jgi:hypothetical protein